MRITTATCWWPRLLVQVHQVLGSAVAHAHLRRQQTSSWHACLLGMPEGRHAGMRAGSARPRTTRSCSWWQALWQLAMMKRQGLPLACC
jgi:hypothetical protein